VPELNISPAFSKMILKAIDKSRELRFQNADEFIAALEQGSAENTAIPQVGTSAASLSNLIPVAKTQPSQVSETLEQTPGIQSAEISAPASASVILQQPGFTPVTVPAAPTQPPLPKSAAQHLFLQQRTFKARNIVVLIGLCLALVVIGGVGYLKYRNIQRLKIQNAVVETLKNSPSLAVRAAHINVSVSDTGEVILDGAVPTSADSNTAASLSAAVSGVNRVNNRLQVVPPETPPPNTNSGESSDSLVDKGIASMDAGDYATAIDCFTRAANDPNNKRARQMLEAARRAQKTEEQLLKKRR
jgi:hypothetical protein